MKKVLATSMILILAVAMSANIVFADDTADYSAVVVSITETSELMPVNVIQSQDGMEIRKVYELSPDVNPERLPHEDFERGGLIFSCSDILREVLIGDEIKTITVLETAESKKDDTDTILSVLQPFKEVEEPDGFLGKLYLNENSIKSEASGYGTASMPYTVSKSYTGLSSNDPYNIPKTIDDNGRSLQLKDIKWQGNIYGEGSGNYTAVATYGGVKTSQYVDGYVISAEYTGEVSRKGVDVIRYTVIYIGTAIPSQVTEAEPEPPNESAQGSGLLIVVFFILLLLGAGAAAYYFLIKKKSLPRYDKEQEYPREDYYDGSGDDPSADEIDYSQDQ